MSYTKFPIACWQDAQQTFYARTVSGSDVSAADADQKKCLEQIRAALIWMSENRYVERPEFETPQIETGAGSRSALARQRNVLSTTALYLGQTR